MMRYVQSRLGFRRWRQLVFFYNITISPPLEELVFRWLPLYFVGLPAMVFFSAIWVLLHDFDDVAWWSVTIGGAAFCTLWWAHLGLLAIGAHCGWNLLTSWLQIKAERRWNNGWNPGMKVPKNVARLFSDIGEEQRNEKDNSIWQSFQ